MPTYEYLCLDCDETFTRTERMSEHEETTPSCPECGSEKVEPQLSPVFAKTSRKS